MTWQTDKRYEQLLQRHSASLLRAAMLIARNRQDAEDALQDAAISVAMAWPRVREGSELAYLRRAMINNLISHWRHNREDAFETLPEQAYEDAGMLRYEDDRMFRETVLALPPGQRTVLVLRYHMQLPDAEISRVLKCSLSTVRSQALRGLQKLREQHHERDERTNNGPHPVAG